MRIHGRLIFTITLLAILFSYQHVFCEVQTHTRSKNLTMLFWGASVDKPIMDFFYRGCRAFEEENPDITIKVDFYSVEQYKTKLPLLMAMNKPPDIFMTWSGAFLETYIGAGKVLPLNPFLETDPAWKNTFKASAFDSVRFNGHIYAVPTSMAVAVLYYNRQIFNRYDVTPPKTYADLKRSIRTFREHGVTPMAFGNKEPWVGGMLAGQLIQRVAGRPLFNEIKSGDIAWTHPLLIQTGRIMGELVRIEAFPKGFNNISYKQMIDMFSQGQAAMMLMGTWFFQNLFNESPLPEGAVGVSAFPVWDDKSKADHIWMGQTDMNLAVSSQCKEKNAAIRFLKYISSPSSQRQLLQKTGALPVTRVDMNKIPCRSEVVALSRLFNAMESMYLFPDISLGGVAGHDFNTSMKAILSGSDPAMVFQQMENKLNPGQGSQ